jgi:hypothetical protein
MKGDAVNAVKDAGEQPGTQGGGGEPPNPALGRLGSRFAERRLH